MNQSNFFKIIKEKCNQIKPLVIIHCFTYNHESYIKDALEGFVMQRTNFPFIAIIHDDASTDNTPTIIGEYVKKYPEIIFALIETENQYSKKDGSLTRIMKEGILNSGAKYIALCEGDDYWIDQYKLQKQIDFLENNPNYGLCYTKIKKFIQSKGKYSQIWGGKNETFDELIIENTIPTLTVVIKSQLYFKYYHDVNPETKGWKMGDFPIWLYTTQNSKIKFLDEITGVYRVLEESASHSKDYNKVLNFLLSNCEIILFYCNRLNYPSVEIECLMEETKLQLAVKHNSSLEINNQKKILKNYLKKKLKFKQFIRTFLLVLFPRITTKLIERRLSKIRLS